MFKRKNIKVLAIEILVIVMVIIGVTFALKGKIEINASTSNLAVTYTGTATLPTTSLFPIPDSEVETNTESVMKVEFSVKGASSNTTTDPIIYDVILSDLNVECELKKYLKWRLYKNNSLLEEGSFLPEFDALKDNKLWLTETQQDLPKSNQTADSYKLLIWISESCSDITKCSREDNQRDVLNRTISGKVEIILSTNSKKELVRPVSFEGVNCNVAPNSPDLVDGLIPVVYNGSNWVVTNNKSNEVTVSYKLGDANRDGKIANQDLTRIKAATLGKGNDFDSYVLHAGDLDGNGKITTNDFNLMGKYLNSEITTFPAGAPLKEGTYTTDAYKWYDYDNKKWANAVLVSSTNRATYKSASVGTVVADSDILAHYVWIPRFKYKVWNINKVMGTNSYNSEDRGIDLKFESEKTTTGTIKCTNYSFAAPSSSANSPNETCSGTNGEYYTHPAFTFGDTELRGIWVGKFEISSSTPTASNGGDNSTTLTVRTKPNVNSWRNNTATNYSTVIRNMNATNNEYGLSTDSDSHMLKNMEWGAVAYLTHSKYGRCSRGSCERVELNGYFSGTTSSGYKTGCGPLEAGSESYGTTCNEYNTELGQLASTTGNVYGIYDMSGAAYEFVMANMSSAAGSYTFFASNGGTNFTYSASTAKYMDTYAYGTTYNNQAAYNRARLGDSTGEVVKSAEKGWHNDYAHFIYSGSNNAWFIRGCYYGLGSGAGIFSFYRHTGQTVYSSTRICLVDI